MSMKDKDFEQQDLRVLPCLSAMEEEELNIIGQKAVLKTVAKNEVLFTESEPARFFFILKAGSVKLFKTSREGRELIIKTMKPGDYFCCAAIFTDGKSLVSAMAIEDSTLIAIPADFFEDMLCSSLNATGFKILSGLCTKIRHLSGLVEDLTFKDVEQRIILTLLRLAEGKSPEENIVTLAVTHQDIAPER